MNDDVDGSVSSVGREGWKRLGVDGMPEEGRTLVARLGTSVGVLLTRSGGRLYATQTGCGHMRYPLGKGRIERRVITCPLHHAQFDLSTGGLVSPPRIPWILGLTKVGKQMGLIPCDALRTYEVEERPDGVFLRGRVLPPAGP